MVHFSLASHLTLTLKRMDFRLLEEFAYCTSSQKGTKEKTLESTVCWSCFRKSSRRLFLHPYQVHWMMLNLWSRLNSARAVWRHSHRFKSYGGLRRIASAPSFWLYRQRKGRREHRSKHLLPAFIDQKLNPFFVGTLTENGPFPDLYMAVGHLRPYISNEPIQVFPLRSLTRRSCALILLPHQGRYGPRGECYSDLLWSTIGELNTKQGFASPNKSQLCDMAN